MAQDLIAASLFEFDASAASLRTSRFMGTSLIDVDFNGPTYAGYQMKQFDLAK
ncbi:hypothetical protein [Streptomyces sp. AC602_WCS936]|uniref:hypothetical protein n=1 Tax=Streptomyces sp. AC602_WCS936 TaxID=2823685 RepID=UPI001C263905|nr:hypothetical protein [Streptomyces sp. AC602_WCS936]